MKSESANWDYSQAPTRGGPKFPRMYAHVKIKSAEKRETDDGRVYFAYEGEIVPPHANGTKKYDGHDVFGSFFVGTEEDPDATDPKTWEKRTGLKGAEFAHQLTVAAMIELITKAGLVKDGKGLPPWKLFMKLEGKTVVIFFGSREGFEKVDGKKVATGKVYDDWTYYAVGEREPMVLGAKADTKKAKREDDEDEEEEEEEETPRRKGKREADEDEEEEEEEEPEEEEEEEDEDEEEEEAPRRRSTSAKTSSKVKKRRK